MILASKFPGRCITCGAAVRVGQRVEWVKGRKGVVCCAAEIKVQDEKIEASRNVDADVEVPAPDGLAYLPYQRGGVAYALAAKEGCLFGDEMGLGKTIQAIGVINADEYTRRVLVICPKSLVLNWVKELRKWLTRPMPVARVGWEHSDTAVTVSSYEETKKYQEHLTRGWDLVVVDEAHLVKNPKAQRSKAVRAVSANARRRIAMTGTPIVNRPMELFPILALVAPEQWNPKGVDDKGQLRGAFAFGLRYAGGFKARWGWDFTGSTNREELNDKLRATCMVRRLKKDVLKDLPPKRRQIVPLQVEGADAAVRAEREAWEEQELQLEEARARAELARASDDPEDYDRAAKDLSTTARSCFAMISKMRHATALLKVPAVIEHVRAALEDGDEKIILFAHHHDVIDQLKDGLMEFSPLVLTGETEINARQDRVERFQTDPRHRVFIGNIQAAGVGITLTASSHVVFAELSWVPGEVSQAEDRAHRIGQTDSVLVQHLVLDGSMDADMVATIVEKQRVMDDVLDRVYQPEVALPGKAPATAGKREELDRVAQLLTETQVAQIHGALQVLAGRCDGARSLDGAGFARIDVRIGKDLAAAPRLSRRQAALGLRLVRKYRGQLGALAEVDVAEAA